MLTKRTMIASSRPPVETSDHPVNQIDYLGTPAYQRVINPLEAYIPLPRHLQTVLLPIDPSTNTYTYTEENIDIYIQHAEDTYNPEDIQLIRILFNYIEKNRRLQDNLVFASQAAETIANLTQHLSGELRYEMALVIVDLVQAVDMYGLQEQVRLSPLVKRFIRAIHSPTGTRNLLRQFVPPEENRLPMGPEHYQQKRRDYATHLREQLVRTLWTNAESLTECDLEASEYTEYLESIADTLLDGDLTRDEAGTYAQSLIGIHTHYAMEIAQYINTGFSYHFREAIRFYPIRTQDSLRALARDIIVGYLHAAFSGNQTFERYMRQDIAQEVWTSPFSSSYLPLLQSSVLGLHYLLRFLPPEYRPRWNIPNPLTIRNLRDKQERFTQSVEMSSPLMPILYEIWQAGWRDPDIQAFCQDLLSFAESMEDERVSLTSYQTRLQALQEQQYTAQNGFGMLARYGVTIQTTPKKRFVTITFSPRGKQQMKVRFPLPVDKNREIQAQLLGRRVQLLAAYRGTDVNHIIGLN